MNFAEARAYLKSLINRTDMTDELAAQFIQQSQDRLERWPQLDPMRYAPRPSFMEKYVSFTLDATAEGAFTVPNDFLELIDVHSGSCEAARVDLTRFLKIPPAASGTPTSFVQIGHSIRLRPVPSPDTEVFLRYYGTAQPLVVDTDENAWTISCIDALIYGAAEYAADHFEDERLQRFSGKFKEALMELQDQTLNEAFSGPMAIGPAYDFQD